MTIIEIQALSNGAHRNQTIDGHITPPDGWAAIPDSMAIPDTFPFVDITAQDGVVTEMTANQEAYDAAVAARPTHDPETEPADVWAELDAAYQQGYAEGVNSVE